MLYIVRKHIFALSYEIIRVSSSLFLMWFRIVCKNAAKTENSSRYVLHEFSQINSECFQTIYWVNRRPNCPLSIWPCKRRTFGRSLARANSLGLPRNKNGVSADCANRLMRGCLVCRSPVLVCEVSSHGVGDCTSERIRRRWFEKYRARNFSHV